VHTSAIYATLKSTQRRYRRVAGARVQVRNT